MKTRRLGKTDIIVSQLVLGGGYVGGVLVHQDEETKTLAMQHALRSGINFVDTAPSYGDGESERAIGRILKEINETPYVSTKVAIEEDSRNDLVGQIERSLHASLARLQRNSVDLLQLHNPLSAEDNGATLSIKHLFAKNGIIEALEKFRSEGLAKFIGFTALGDTSQCIEAINSGSFDTAQIYYNLLNPSAGKNMPSSWHGQNFSGLIDTCLSKDVGVMNIRVFAAGVLATKKRTGREVPITSETDFSLERRRAEMVFKILQEQNCSQAQLALRFSLTNPAISCVLIGVSNLAELEEALKGESYGPLARSSIDSLEDVYAKNFGL